MTVGEAAKYVLFQVADNRKADVLRGTLFIDIYMRTMSPEPWSIAMTEGVPLTGIPGDIMTKKEEKTTATMHV